MKDLNKVDLNVGDWIKIYFFPSEINSIHFEIGKIIFIKNDCNSYGYIDVKLLSGNFVSCRAYLSQKISKEDITFLILIKNSI